MLGFGPRMMLRAVQTRRWAKLIACRVPSCSFAPRMRHSSTGNSPRFEQCFIAEHNAKDGRLFRFATLVLRGMQEGESPLAAWAHGRSLLGPRSPPTLAVVFISKPTQAAILAVQELASHFSSSAEGRSQEIPQILSVPQSLSPPNPNSSPSSSSSSWNASVQSSSFALDVGEEKAEIVPLIGCVVENLGLEYGDDMQPLGSGHGERTENAGCRASSNFTGDRPSGTGGNNFGQNGGARLQANSSADGLDGVKGTPPLATGKGNGMNEEGLNPLEMFGNKDEGRDISTRECLVNECGILVHEVEQNGSEKGQAERRVAGGIGDIVSDEDEGTLMDWEELCEDYAKLKGKDICASEAPIREEVEENRDLLAFEADNPKMAGETTSLLGFLNDLPEPVLLHAVNTMSQGTLNQQTSNQNWDPKLGTSIGKCLLS